MDARAFWTDAVEARWRERSILWLTGVRRAGKTVLCQSLPDVEYFDCELPSARRQMRDPEAFLDSLRGRRLVLDEVHRLPDPSALLKIAADHYRDIRVLATGSSTLAATRKFTDSLTGRKAELWLTPATSDDIAAFRRPLDQRLLRGGLPPFLLASALPERDFQEWMDSYWAKDIQELFRLARRDSFIRFVELLLIASGGIFEATRFAGPCEVSRPTIVNYLSVLEATFVAHVVRPYSKGKSAEILAAPKVYGFDTGFACYFRGHATLRPDDFGGLWEHYVLNELHARLQTRRIHYWRTKQGAEVDFVLAPRGKPPVAIECKWSADDFDPRGLKAFTSRYPDATCYVVAPNVARAYTHRESTFRAEVVDLATLITRVRPAVTPGL